MKYTTTLISIFIITLISAQEIIDVNYPIANGQNSGNTVFISDTKSIYSAGEFKGDIDLGGQLVVSNSNQNVFFSKRNQNGDFEWMNSIKSTRNVFVNKILVRENEIFIGGGYSDSLFLGTDTLINTVQKGFYVGVFDTLGVFQYSLNPDCESGKLLDFVLSNNNELCITGTFFNEFVFAGQTYDSPLGTNFFLLKYDLSNLTESWLTSSTGSNTNSNKVRIDTDGNIIIVGSYGQSAVIGGVPLLDNGTEHNTYVAKFNSSGGFLWVETIIGLDQIHGFGLAIGDDNDVYVCGEFELTVSVPDGSTMNTEGLMDGVIYKYDTDGIYQWAKQIGGIDNDAAIDIVMGFNGNPIVLLNSGRGIIFESNSMDPNGFNEPLIVKLNKFNGAHIWHKRIPSLFQSGVVKANSIAIQDSLICVTGENFTGIEFNSNLIVSNNLHDFYLALIDDNDYDEYPTSQATINEIENTSVLVYPNPFKSDLNIICNQPMKRIELFSLDGKLIYSKKAKDLTITIFPNLNSGSYILIVKTEHSITTTKINRL